MRLKGTTSLLHRATRVTLPASPLEKSIPRRFQHSAALAKSIYRSTPIPTPPPLKSARLDTTHEGFGTWVAAQVEEVDTDMTDVTMDEVPTAKLIDGTAIAK